ncbi:MAG: glycosyltransferase family 2 protein [Acidimicrobiia bacterium]|nr:glycosyltransferase family 2 protein [Acidimicrobiia bacterium]
MSQIAPAVSVIIPILNEVRTIDATLESVVCQSYPELEILVVDGVSDDGTLAKLLAWSAQDPRVRVLTNHRKSIPTGLNLGLREATGSYLVRVDAHCTIPNDYVERLVTHLQTGKWAGVGGKKEAVGSPPSGAAIAASLGSPFGVGGSAYHYATEPMETDHIPFGAYGTDLARELGGWDERLVANEDYEFDVRVRASGGKLLLDPTIEVAWRCRSRIIDLARQYRRYGRGKADVAFLHPSEVRFRHAAPPLVVAALVVCAGLLPFFPLLLPGVLLVYLALLIGMSAPIMRTLGSWRDRFRVPGVLGAMQLAWGWGVWEGLARIARYGFRLPEASGVDSTRWGSPEWAVEDEPPIT